MSLIYIISNHESQWQFCKTDEWSLLYTTLLTQYNVLLVLLATTCGNDRHSDTGYITSPNYPASYSNNLFCAWSVTSSSAILDLLISDMDIADGAIGCPNDSLIVSFYCWNINILFS